jgi:hypothetical protein
MGVDLMGPHGEASFNWPTWRHCLKVALVFGWRPAGTVLRTDYDDRWGGTYFSNDYQEVTDDDAHALAAALYRAVTALWTGQGRTEEQVKACDGVSVDVICKLADYAALGRFAIA